VPPPMEVLIVLVPFVVAGLIVLFIAFWGGPSAAREAYLTRGGRIFTFAMVLLYLGLGVAVPAAVIASRGEAVGGTGSLRSEEAKGTLADGKQLFIQTCKSCHTLAAVDAHGVTGPNLDELGGLDKQRVLHAIKIGGTGDGRMPPELLTGSDADAVATYVSAVAGR
jgi:cytochrome c553